MMHACYGSKFTPSRNHDCDCRIGRDHTEDAHLKDIDRQQIEQNNVQLFYATGEDPQVVVAQFDLGQWNQLVELARENNKMDLFAGVEESIEDRYTGGM